MLERQLEGAELLGGELAAPAAVVNLDQFFVPLQRTMAAPSVDIMKARFPEYAWVNAALPGRTLLDPSVEWPVTLARFRTPQWRFPTSLIDPLIWYWTHLRFYDEPSELQGARGGHLCMSYPWISTSSLGCPPFAERA